MRKLLPLVCLALAACASPRWVNPQNPAADLDGDIAACNKDAERIGRLHQLGSKSLTRNCVDGAMCLSLAETERIRMEAEAVKAQQRCLEGRGWRARADGIVMRQDSHLYA